MTVRQVPVCGFKAWRRFCKTTTNFNPGSQDPHIFDPICVIHHPPSPVLSFHPPILSSDKASTRWFPCTLQISSAKTCNSSRTLHHLGLHQSRCLGRCTTIKSNSTCLSLRTGEPSTSMLWTQNRPQTSTSPPLPPPSHQPPRPNARRQRRRSGSCSVAAIVKEL